MPAHASWRRNEQGVRKPMGFRKVLSAVLSAVSAKPGPSFSRGEAKRALLRMGDHMRAPNSFLSVIALLIHLILFQEDT